MVLYIVGLGLSDEKDITVKGLEIVKRCSRVFLEHYTAILGVGKERLESFYGRPIELADRTMVEQEAHKILADARDGEVAFLVVGDPLAATTHTDMMLRAAEKGIRCEVVHNASIMNACAISGLQLYTFGQSVSICFFTEKSRPSSWYDKIKVNNTARLHTLCLLDIRVKEQTFENLMKGNKIFEPPRFMTVNEAILQLLEIEEERKEGVVTPDSLAVGLARVGAPDQLVVAGTLKELLMVNFGAPLHALVLAGPEVHFLEHEMLNLVSWRKLPPSQLYNEAPTLTLETKAPAHQPEIEEEEEPAEEFMHEPSLFSKTAAPASSESAAAPSPAPSASTEESKAAALPLMTAQELSQHSGNNADTSVPIYVCIDGDVFDVSSRRDLYGTGGSYAILTGRDASRALAKSSLSPEDANSSNLSDITAEEREVMKQWYSTFAKKYPIVAKLAQSKPKL